MLSLADYFDYIRYVAPYPLFFLLLMILSRLHQLLCVPNHVSVLNAIMLICVHDCMKYVHTEKYAKMQCAICTLKIVKNEVFNDECITNAILANQEKWYNGISMLAKVSLLAIELLVMAGHFNQASMLCSVRVWYIVFFHLLATSHEKSSRRRRGKKELSVPKQFARFRTTLLMFRLVQYAKSVLHWSMLTEACHLGRSLFLKSKNDFWKT